MFTKLNYHEVIELIKDKEEFTIKTDSDLGYICINYNVNFRDTFPEYLPADTSEDRKVKSIFRELRGLIFDINTKEVIRRPWHKFFNIGERVETSVSTVDWSQKHYVLSKLDGSMIAPFISNGNLYWGTKMGKTDLSQQPEQFVSDKPHYVNFVTTMIKSGKTPIFEWCSRKQRIVLDYPIDKLYLVGIRDMETGNYSSYQELKTLANQYSIDLVEYYSDSISDINNFINHTKDLVDEEGYVVVFENGDMLKIKADDYVKIHKCLDGFRYEKDIIKIIVNDDLDDVLPYLRDDLKNDVVLYSDRILHNISHLSVEIFDYIVALFEKYGDSKENRRYVAENVQKDYPKDSGIVFSCYKGDVSLNDVREQIVLKIDKNTSSISKVENIRHIIKENWNNYGLSGLSFDN